MPIYLKDVDVIHRVSKFQSALIVLCRFCPAASLAIWNLTIFDIVSYQKLTSYLDICGFHLIKRPDNLIYGRVLPGENAAGRVINNVERLFTLLSAKRHDGIVLSEQLSKKKY
jgi:hypothetical protein